jgi:hypothetical protein
MPRITSTRVCAIAISALCAVSVASCKRGDRKKTTAAEWIEHPTAGKTSGSTISFDSLGVKFTTPDTLYVYKKCGEASHAPEGEHGWVPIIVCHSAGSSEVFGSDDDSEEDGELEGGGGFGGGDDDIADSGEVEEINVTFYVTHKSRPLDERAVQWFESQYKQAGLSVDEISFQHDFQKKSGIYAKLHVTDGTTPTREIIQFMFPRNDVVFIARMEYPFGDKRSIDQDWKYILWNFDWIGG